jgi:hypothetical protein
MTSRTLAVIALPVLLAACAPTVFTRPPGVDEAQFHRDNFECSMQAKAFVGDQFVMGPPLMIAAAQIGHDNAMKAAHDECMLGKAYTVQKDSR